MVRIVPHGQTGKFAFCARKIFFAIKFARLKNRPRISSPYEMVYFSSIMFKFCALDWVLHAWQLACAWKIFSAHDILSSLATRSLPVLLQISKPLAGYLLGFSSQYVFCLDLISMLIRFLIFNIQPYKPLAFSF